MFLSVIIPSYNREKYIGAALDSLVGQSVGKDTFEVIVVHDGSIDNTKKVVELFSDKLDIKYIYQDHGGVCRARNAGIESSRGDVLVFFDDDAVCDSRWLEKVMDVMIIEDVVVGRGLPLNKNMWQYFCPHYDRGDAAIDIPGIWECNLAVKKSVVEKVGMFDPDIDWGHEGNEFAARCKAGGYKIMYQPSMVIYHDYALGFLNYIIKQYKFGKKVKYLRDKKANISEHLYNEKLEKLPVLKKIFIKLIARLGKWSHRAGEILGK